VTVRNPIDTTSQTKPGVSENKPGFFKKPGLFSLGRHVLALLGLMALIVLLYWPLFTVRPGDQRSLSSGDLTSLFYPAAVYDVQQLRQGQLALWHPDVLGGHPYLAQLQTQVLYPVRWLTTLLAIVMSDGELSYTGFAAETMAHLVLAGWGAYLFFRRISRSYTAGLFGGIAWGLSGYLTGYPIQHTPILYSAVWLPWLLWSLTHNSLPLLSLSKDDRGGCRRAVPSEGWGLEGLRWLFLTALFWAMPLLAGMPQNALYIALVAVPFAAWQIGQAPRELRATLIQRNLLALLLGIGLMAAQLLPALEIMAYAERTDWAFAQKATGFEIQDLVGLIYPRLTTWSPLYVGMPTLLLALISLRRAGREGVLWLAIAALGLALSLAAQTALFPWLYRAVPIFALFRNQERGALLVSFSLIALAVHALSILSLSKDDGGRLRWDSPSAGRGTPLRIGTLLGAWWFLILAAALWISFQPLEQRPGLHAQLSKALWAPITATLAWLVMRFDAPTNKWGGALLVGLIALDVGTVAWQTAYANHFAPQPPGQVSAPLFKSDRLPAEYQSYRIDTRGLFNKDRFVLSGIEDLHGQLPLELANFKRFRAEVPGERLWALMGVGCYARDQAEPALPFASSPIAEFTSGENKQVGVYCLAQPFHRYRMVYEAVQFDDATAIAAMRDGNFDPLKTAILDQPVTLVTSPVNTPPKVAVITQHPHRTTLQVTTERDGLLVIGDVYYPGWVARMGGVGGARAPVMQAYSALRAVQIPAGTHEVTLSFEPLSFWVGAALSLLTLLGMAVSAFVVILRPPP
jgi:hypothetical protein